MQSPARASIRVAIVAATVLGVLPMAPAEADETRILLGLEAAAVTPASEPTLRQFHPGATGSVALLLSLTGYLMPVVRARQLVLSAGEEARDDYGGLGRLTSLGLGLRFRPRGIAHPEEPSRASCVWGEITAGLAAWNRSLEPSFEAAVGFAFVVDATTLGPVARFVHVLPVATGDEADAFLVTLGLEVLVHDAR